MRSRMWKIAVIGVLFCLAGCANSKEKIDESVDNLYFYNQEQVFLETTAEFYEEESSTTKRIEAEIYLVGKYQYGDLYRFSIEPVGDLSTERLNIYFYVTEEKIYRIWAYIYQDDEFIEFYDDDALLMEFLATDEKLIENGELVFQLEEKTGQSENGANYSISIVEDQVIYSSYNTKENGEIYFYEWFTWEKGKGLVDYGSGYGIESDILYLTQIEIIR